MKKISVLFALFVFAFSISKAGSFSITYSETTVTDTTIGGIMVGHVYVKNTSNAPVRVIVKRTVQAIDPMQFSYFCWGVNCYSPATSQSPDIITIPANTENQTFKGYLDPQGILTDSRVSYRFINADNPADTLGFTILYRSGIALGITESVSASLFKIAGANPASGSSLQLAVGLSGVYGIQVTDTRGQLLHRGSFTGATIQLPVSDLPAGMYRISLLYAGKTLRSLPFIKE